MVSLEEIQKRRAVWLHGLIPLVDQRILITEKIQDMKDRNMLDGISALEKLLDDNKEEMLRYVKTKTP